MGLYRGSNFTSSQGSGKKSSYIVSALTLQQAPGHLETPEVGLGHWGNIRVILV